MTKLPEWGELTIPLTPIPTYFGWSTCWNRSCTALISSIGYSVSKEFGRQVWGVFCLSKQNNICTHLNIVYKDRWRIVKKYQSLRNSDCGVVLRYRGAADTCAQPIAGPCQLSKCKFVRKFGFDQLFDAIKTDGVRFRYLAMAVEICQHRSSFQLLKFLVVRNLNAAFVSKTTTK